MGLAKKFLSAQAGFSDTSVLPDSFVQPLAETKWPGRCQVVPDGQLTWLLDGAHTVESLKSCGEWAWGWDAGGAPNVLIFNCSGGRQGETLLSALLQAGADTDATTIQALGSAFDTVVFCTNVTYTDGGFKGDLTAHALDPADLAALATQNALREAWLNLVPGFDEGSVHAVPSIQHAVEIVRGLGERRVLVAGSLHLVGGVMEVAGLQRALSMV